MSETKFLFSFDLHGSCLKKYNIYHKNPCLYPALIITYNVLIFLVQEVQNCQNIKYFLNIWFVYITYHQLPLAERKICAKIKRKIEAATYLCIVELIVNDVKIVKCLIAFTYFSKHKIHMFFITKRCKRFICTFLYFDKRHFYYSNQHITLYHKKS